MNQDNKKYLKTLKTKVILSESHEAMFNEIAAGVSWIWDMALMNQYHNHCLRWYNWAEGKSSEALDAKSKIADMNYADQERILSYFYPRKGSEKPKLSQKDKNAFGILELWEPFTFDGIVKCPLEIGRSPYYGVACRIAVGGNYWTRDDSVNIPYRDKNGEICYKKGYKLVPGDRPWQRIEIKPHVYRQYPGGKGKDLTLKDIRKFDRKGGLNSIRREKDLPEFTFNSDYINGVVSALEISWKSFLNPSNEKAKKPRLKRGELCSSLVNIEKNPPRIRLVGNKVCVDIKDFDGLEICDRDFLRRVKSMTGLSKNATIDEVNSRLKTYVLSKKPSGFYLNIVVECQAQQLPKTGLSTGIDPGVKAVIATDHGALFNPNSSRDRVQKHIEDLQSRLDNKRLANEARHKKSGNKGKHTPTCNESRLQAKISRLHEQGSNSSNAFNHKLSTRIARTYDAIAWEDTQLTNMMKQVEAKASSEGVGYEKNGATAKAGLNKSLRLRSLGDLKAKTKKKAEDGGKKFVETKAPYSSQKCSCCQQKGDRASQSEFICRNEKCSNFGVVVNADVNAARNHKLSMLSKKE